MYFLFEIFSYNEKKNSERQYIGTQELSQEDIPQVWASLVEKQQWF